MTPEWLKIANETDKPVTLADLRQTVMVWPDNWLMIVILLRLLNDWKFEQ